MGSYKKNFIIAVSVSGLVLLASIFFMWWSSFVLLEKEQERYVKNREEIAEIEQRLSMRRELEREVQRVEEDIDLITGSLLKEGDVSDFIEELESIAQQTGNSYNIRDLREIRNPSTSDTDAFDFVLDLGGSFSSLLPFLQSVKELPYLTDFNRLSISANEEGDTTTNLTIRVYVR